MGGSIGAASAHAMVSRIAGRQTIGTNELIGDDPAAPPVDCEKSGATAKVAFDFICEIALTGQAPAVSVEINRVAGGQVAPPDLIVIGQIEP